MTEREERAGRTNEIIEVFRSSVMMWVYTSEGGLTLTLVERPGPLISKCLNRIDLR